MHILVLVVLVGLAFAVGVSRFGWPWKRERTSVTAAQKRQYIDGLLPQAAEVMRARGASEEEISEAFAKVKAAEDDLQDSKSDHVPGVW